MVNAVSQILDVPRPTVFEHVRRMREDPFPKYWPRQTKSLTKSPPVQEEHVANLLGVVMAGAAARESIERVTSLEHCQVNYHYLTKYIDPAANYALAKGPLRRLFFDADYSADPLFNGPRHLAPFRDFTRERYHAVNNGLSFLDALTIVLRALRAYPGLVHECGASYFVYKPRSNEGSVTFVASHLDIDTGDYFPNDDADELSLDFADTTPSRTVKGFETQTFLEFSLLSDLANEIERSSRHGQRTE